METVEKKSDPYAGWSEAEKSMAACINANAEYQVRTSKKSLLKKILAFRPSPVEAIAIFSVLFFAGLLCSHLV